MRSGGDPPLEIKWCLSYSGGDGMEKRRYFFLIEGEISVVADSLGEANIAVREEASKEDLRYFLDYTEPVVLDETGCIMEVSR